ncbi:MAG TPA: precorrin-8X methylmutase [Terriglobia bacterium]|nr:precorrin-8X methylmutase [Terriglobia bacterium]
MNEDSSRIKRSGISLIHALYDKPMSGEAIEARSLEIIEQEAPSRPFSHEQWQVVKRMLHTTADFGLVDHIRFSDDAIEAAVMALTGGCPILVDSNMIRAGISLARLRAACEKYSPESLICHVADEDVAAAAREAGLPRSLYAVRKARSGLDKGIAVFGNAPVALMELNRLISEEEIRPAFVIAMPVGFVHVTESKDEFMSLGVPYVAVAGRRGGSPLAVSALHALCGLAAEKRKK